ncbi:MAG: Ig-like domain-containing protein [Muribaculaceae bacterium]|nr:Ig-like domain-containing protein [Muribaculaceae bacterium]
MKKYQRHILFFAGTIIAFIMVACASIGRPEGGPRDEMPPVFIKSNPTQGQTNVKSNKIEIFFDENLKVDDASNKVVISPVQKAMPSIIANGKKVSVELRDTLIPNTTYTIDFSDAIQDLNEGNPVDGFALDFSTGDSIDSLRISGMLFEARNLEPAQGMIVGVYSNLADSAISTLPLERISKTNQLGQFTIRGLKPGYYRIFALNDKNRDYHWDRSEDVAFYDVALSPSVEPIEVMDTLRASDGKDSLVSRQGVKFLPNNVLLTWFNEGYAAQYLKDYKRPERNRITFDFATKADTLPQITLINGKKAGLDIDEWALLNAGETLDTLEYWINDSVILAQDSILVAARYLRTDTNENLSWTTDTLKLLYKEPKKKKKKD